MRSSDLPTRRGWRYFATRLNGDGTETLLDPDLPLEDVQVDDILSGHNGLQGKLEPVYKRLLGPDGFPLFNEWSTAVYAENDGDIRGAGILSESDFDGPAWSIECSGFTSYSIDMPWTAAAAVTDDPPGWKVPAGKDGSGFGVKVDPIDMARVIWRQIQRHPGGNLGLTFDATTTRGRVTVGTELQQAEFDTQEGPVSFEAGPYKLNWHTNHDLSSDFDDLAADTPFDYHERHFWDANGVLRHHVDIGYPTLGRRREDLRFVYGVNIFDPVAMARAGADYASGTLVLGAGTGASAIRSLREPATRPENRLRRIAVVVDDTIKSRKRADLRGDRENQWRARLNDVESVVVHDHPNAPLGAVQVGDEIRIEGRGDWADIDMWVRVLSITFEPENGQIAEYSIARTDRLT